MYEINDIIERETNDYYNCRLTIFDGNNDSEKENCIISIPNYLYCKRNITLFNEFQKRFYKLNKKLRSLDGPGFEEFENIINNSPVVPYPFTVYRGVPKKLNIAPDQILKNLGYIHTSLYQDLALQFALNNSKSCYSDDENNQDCSVVNGVYGYMIEVKRGTLFKINVPPNTHFYSHCFMDLWIREFECEIIFNKDIQLMVKEITKYEKYDEILCDIIIPCYS